MVVCRVELSSQLSCDVTAKTGRTPVPRRNPFFSQTLYLVCKRQSGRQKEDRSGRYSPDTQIPKRTFPPELSSLGDEDAHGTKHGVRHSGPRKYLHKWTTECVNQPFINSFDCVSKAVIKIEPFSWIAPTEIPCPGRVWFWRLYELPSNLISRSLSSHTFSGCFSSSLSAFPL